MGASTKSGGMTMYPGAWGGGSRARLGGLTGQQGVDASVAGQGVGIADMISGARNRMGVQNAANAPAGQGPNINELVGAVAGRLNEVPQPVRGPVFGQEMDRAQYLSQLVSILRGMGVT